MPKSLCEVKSNTIPSLKNIQKNFGFNSIVCCFAGDSKRLSAAKKLESLCTKEMYDIEMCKQCFSRVIENDSDWFTKVCDPPHLLVWAKMKNSPHWPAKVLGQATTGNSLDVRFFGDGNMYYVQPNQCFLYSKIDPNRQKKDVATKNDIATSLKVA